MALADGYALQHPELTPEHRLQLCESLVGQSYHEEVMLGQALIRKLVQRHFDENLLDRFKYWLEHHHSNWAQCDDLCMKVIYQYFLGRPHLITTLDSWLQSPSPWCRRAANVAVLKFIHRKIGKNIYRLPLTHVFHNSTTLLADPDIYVQKSVGWLLKAAADHHRAEVVSFLEAHISQLQRGTLRYAIEKMEPSLREAILSIKT